jgi:hypothetical protein
VADDKMYGPPPSSQAKNDGDKLVCANEYVNKGEGIVKSKAIPLTA